MTGSLDSTYRGFHATLSLRTLLRNLDYLNFLFFKKKHCNSFIVVLITFFQSKTRNVHQGIQLQVQVSPIIPFLVFLIQSFIIFNYIFMTHFNFKQHKLCHVDDLKRTKKTSTSFFPKNVKILNTSSVQHISLMIS